MALKSILRRGSMIAVSAGATLALAACGAGQISQTANQAAAVDGSPNEPAASVGYSDAERGAVEIRDAHIVVNPEEGTAALKFAASNQKRAEGSQFTLRSVEIDGIGTVNLTPVAQSESFEAFNTQGVTIPRECQIFVDSAEAIRTQAAQADSTPACVAYFSSALPAASLVGENSSASGQHRDAAFTFVDNKGEELTYNIKMTVAANILDAGEADRGEDGLIEAP